MTECIRAACWCIAVDKSPVNGQKSSGRSKINTDKYIYWLVLTKSAQEEPAQIGNNDIGLLGSCKLELEKEVSEKWEWERVMVMVMGENAGVETKFCSIHRNLSLKILQPPTVAYGLAILSARIITNP